MTRPHTLVLSVALVALAACSSAPPVAGGRQGLQAIREMQRAMTPTQHLFADADHKLLWKAVKEYMVAAFPVAESEPGFVETETMEWVEWRLPHRTRVTVELEKVRTNPKNVVMLVCALKIEPSLQPEELSTGRAVDWSWVLQGQRRNVEEVVVGQILRHYLLLREGKDPSVLPLEGPIRGLSPNADGYYKAAKATRRRDK
ncbi:MAG: hypothetical protein HRU14_09095 [Planctomycetes bacterium]|nr:hypothetical protein [Planctomycetota bacterium]